ncbi:DNA polymerase III subunit gamma/tau [Candidatus Microgenomates bacterium]|nr:DNA polymerase III subunit gamma/tau [Candidatus Microgenomates bacterium]
MKRAAPVNLVLYRKYRSRDFDELIGQQHVIVSLENALKHGRIGHAYLFAGPRGVGKTTTARILARRVNGLSPQEAANHLDIIEIDAASNRRIDEVRDLREKAHVAPASARYKIYIIDEVHMLTTEAFNALLKTLEEPPAHVIFVLATTEPHKLPETIISRTQRFDFRPIDISLLIEHLQMIANKEKIVIDADSLELIALAADGSVRDSIGMLDQVANIAHGKRVTAQMVSDLLGMAPSQLVDELAVALKQQDPQAVLKLLDQATTQGIGAQQLVQQLLGLWRHILRAKLGLAKPKSKQQQWLLDHLKINQVATIVNALVSLPTQTAHGSLVAEAALVQLALPSSEPESSQEPVPTSQPKVAARTVATTRPGTKDTSKTASRVASAKLRFNEDSWLKTLTILKGSNNSLYALLRSATPEFNNGKLKVQFRFQFHQRRLEESRNKELLAAAFSKVHGRQVTIEPVVTESKTEAPSKMSAQAEAEEDAGAVKDVLQILGGEVVNG